MRNIFQIGHQRPPTGRWRCTAVEMPRVSVRTPSISVVGVAAALGFAIRKDGRGPCKTQGVGYAMKGQFGVFENALKPGC